MLYEKRVVETQARVQDWDGAWGSCPWIYAQRKFSHKISERVVQVNARQIWRTTLHGRPRRRILSHYTYVQRKMRMEKVNNFSRRFVARTGPAFLTRRPDRLHNLMTCNRRDFLDSLKQFPMCKKYSGISSLTDGIAFTSKALSLPAVWLRLTCLH